MKIAQKPVIYDKRKITKSHILFQDITSAIKNYSTYQTEKSTAHLNELAYFVVMTRPMIVVIDHFPFLLGEEKGKCIFKRK